MDGIRVAIGDLMVKDVNIEINVQWRCQRQLPEVTKRSVHTIEKLCKLLLRCISNQRKLSTKPPGIAGHLAYCMHTILMCSRKIPAHGPFALLLRLLAEATPIWSKEQQFEDPLYSCQRHPPSEFLPKTGPLLLADCV